MGQAFTARVLTLLRFVWSLWLFGAAEPQPSSPCAPTTAELRPSTVFEADDPRLLDDRLVVADKRARRLMLFEGGQLRGCWRTGLGFAPTGHKQAEGDGRTPEGWYRTSDKPWSSFEGAIAVHYPSALDARTAHAEGRISRRTRDRIVGAHQRGDLPPQSTSLGGAILIHGGGSGVDWTLGCIALDDHDLHELRATLGGHMRATLLVVP